MISGRTACERRGAFGRIAGRVRRTAQLERACWLHRLHFQEEWLSGLFCHESRGQEGCPDHSPGDGSSRLENIRKRQLHGLFPVSLVVIMKILQGGTCSFVYK